MSSSTPEWTAVVERLEKLERQNRRLKQVGAVALILAAAVLLMGQAPATRTVEANEFVLKDASGNVRGRFSMTIRGPELKLLYPNRTSGATLSLVCSDSPDYCFSSLHLTDPKSKYQVSMGANRRSSDIRVGESFQLQSILPIDTPVLEAIRATPGATLSMDAEDGLRLELKDREGFEATIGTTNLVTPRTGETHKTSVASVVLFDKDKNVLWKAP